MTLPTSFIVTNAISFLLFFLVFLIGATIFGILLNIRTNRLLNASFLKQAHLQDDFISRPT